VHLHVAGVVAPRAEVVAGIALSDGRARSHQGAIVGAALLRAAQPEHEVTMSTMTSSSGRWISMTATPRYRCRVAQSVALRCRTWSCDQSET
jgi:hypothetical protein